MHRKILGESKPVLEMIALINKVAQAKTNVLIIGESGTGKELVARMIHEAGPLKGKPFVPINCGAIPENLIESEMFGHKKGSFTGAVSEKAGLFEAAHGGTLFLDEVGELPLPMQVKLLRAIQERCFKKVGGTEDIRVDVRIIAATNRDLEAGIAKNTFREDLYYRLNVILIKTPPLRVRKSDILLLANHFLERISKTQKKEMHGFSPEALDVLQSYEWPGNVRELENVVERLVTLEGGAVVGTIGFPSNILAAVQKTKGIGTVESSGPGVAGSGATVGSVSEMKIPAPDFTRGPLNLDLILGDIEKMYLLKALDHAEGVKKKAAALLGITFRSMRYRLKKLGMDAGGDIEGPEDE